MEDTHILIIVLISDVDSNVVINDVCDDVTR